MSMACAKRLSRFMAGSLAVALFLPMRIPLLDVLSGFLKIAPGSILDSLTRSDPTIWAQAGIPSVYSLTTGEGDGARGRPDEVDHVGTGVGQVEDGEGAG